MKCSTCPRAAIFIVRADHQLHLGGTPTCIECLANNWPGGRYWAAEIAQGRYKAMVPKGRKMVAKK